MYRKSANHSVSGFKSIILPLWMICCLGVLTNSSQTAYGHPPTESDSLFYTVQPGDFLIKIGISYGSPNFWRPIYETNRHQIESPDLIYPNQRLLIPPSVRNSDKFVARESAKEDSLQELSKFREAFRTLMEEKRQKSINNYQSNQQNGLEFGGLVINETRSKMGRDFFNVFYRYWEAPPDAPNFLLSITEKPLPSLGTVVTVKLDGRPVYQTKLQPRREIIEQNAKQAVAISYRELQRQIQNSNHLIQY